MYLATAALAGNLAKHAIVHFDQLADAFLHGRLHIATPRDLLDLTHAGGRWYVPFLPLPAIIMLPFVALFGADAPIEAPLSIALGALSVALVYRTLAAMRARCWIDLDARGCVWLTTLFALGTVHWYVACEGTVWFFSQVVTVSALAFAVLAAVRRAHPAAIGALLALAMWARPHVVLALPFFVAELVARERESVDRAGGGIAQRVATLVLPLALGAAGILAYNAARFGDPLDTGYAAQNVNPRLANDLQTRGQFSFAYVARNARIAFLGMPETRDAPPFLAPRSEGMSIFLATPALLYLASGLFRRKRRLGDAARGALISASSDRSSESGARGGARASPWVLGAWSAIVALNVPLLAYYNSGWDQFGYRFFLDYAIFAVMLLARAAGRRVSPVLGALIALSILVNAWGVAWWFGG